MKYYKTKKRKNSIILYLSFRTSLIFKKATKQPSVSRRFRIDFQFSVFNSCNRTQQNEPRKRKHATASQRKNPHPPNRREEKIITTSHSLFFSKITVTKNVTFPLAFYIFLGIYYVTENVTF